MKKNIVIMAGGTGGHIYPALAIAKKLKSNGHNIIWLGSKRGLENKIVPDAGFKLYSLPVRGLRGKNPLWIIKSLLLLLIASFLIIGIYLKYRPKLVIGFGGYASGPSGLIAWVMRHHLIIHEQNSVAGKTNKILSKFAKKVFVAFKDTKGFSLASRKTQDFKKSFDVEGGSSTVDCLDVEDNNQNNVVNDCVFNSKVEVVGNPIREEFSNIVSPDERYSNRKGPLRILVLGGSLGAKTLNEIVPNALSLIKDKVKFEAIHQAGAKGKQLAITSYSKGLGGLNNSNAIFQKDSSIVVDANNEVVESTVIVSAPSEPCGNVDHENNDREFIKVFEYIDDMVSTYSWADIVICRAGALTVSEVMAAGVAAIFVPYPYAVDDHQTKNAEILSNDNAGILMPQCELNAKALAEQLMNLQDRGKLQSIASTAFSMRQVCAAQTMVDYCESVIV